MKKFIYSLSLLLSAIALTACSDFFDPNTDDELSGEQYISSDTEMYTGFLGIMTKLQSIGDKEILLTETRGDLIEVTERSTPELIAIYNYDEDLDGNPYANPAGYYEVIIACNDYLAKMKDYRNLAGVDDNVWQDLVSSTVRIKVWTYKTLGEIYGQAVWFDDPITKLTEISPAKGFELLTIEPLIDRCLTLMNEGCMGVPSTRVIDWIKWLDPTKVTDIANSDYRKWNSMVPPYEGIYAELCLWKGAILDGQTPDDPSSALALHYYKQAATELLTRLNVEINDQGKSSNSYWLPTAWTPGKYSAFWNDAKPLPNESVAALIYDYANRQTNTLLRHFSDEYPNQYLLRPSEVGRNRWLDQSFSPGGNAQDARYKTTIGRANSATPYIAKFRAIGSSSRPNAYQDDVHIYIYRATQYHMLLAEALNNLKRFEAAGAVINKGVTKDVFIAGTPEWEGFTRNWTSDAEWGTRKYCSTGIRGCHELQPRPIVTSLVGTTERAARRANDEAILNEAMLEFAAEGKVYPMMNRMAIRHADISIVSSRVAPKYAPAGKESIIRSRIENGGSLLNATSGNWVKYDLRIMQ